jgi:hypothetical protein
MKYRLAAGLVILVLCGSACGITVDSQPRNISARDGAKPAASASQPALVVGGSERVYFVTEPSPDQPRRLRAVTGTFGKSPRERLSALLAGPTTKQQNGQLQTALPPGTQLLSASLRNDGTLIVDVTKQILTLSGDEQTYAVAQIVFTAEELELVDGVVLKVDGEGHQWPSGDGTLVTRALTTYDYPGLLESSQPDFPALPAEPLG